MKIKSKMRRPGIEPESQEWESCMIPLHQRRLRSLKAENLLENFSAFLIKPVFCAPFLRRLSAKLERVIN